MPEGITYGGSQQGVYRSGFRRSPRTAEVCRPNRDPVRYLSAAPGGSRGEEVP